MGQDQSSTSIAPVSAYNMSPPQDPRQHFMRPFDLLCCTSALPYTLTNLAHLLPGETIHKPLQKPLSLGSILTPFLILLATNATPTPPARIAMFNPYIVLIEVRCSTPVSVTQDPDSTTEIQQEHSEPRYFAVTTPEEEALRQNMGKEMVGGQLHVEVEKSEAEMILRFPGSGAGNLGDGETWTRAEGVEKIWCEKCRVWWEFRAWVRELSGPY